MRKDAWIWLVIIFALVLLAGLGVMGVRLWNRTQANPTQQTGAGSSTAAAQSSPAGNLPLAKFQPAGTQPAGPAWQAAPPCAIEPLSAAQWSAAAPPAFARAAGQSGPQAASAYQALRLNVASGRLNRATGIMVEAFPEIHTVGDLLARIESGANETNGGEPSAGLLTAGTDPAFAPALDAVLSGAAITRPVCARLALLSAGRPAEMLDWTSAQGQAGLLAPANVSSGQLAAVNLGQTSLDSGLASPDGVWAAYTSLGMDAGGPIFIHNLASGTWSNLIALMNKVRAAEQPALNESDWWTVIDWFPDSRRLLIARADASSAVVVDALSGEWQADPFAGEGNGGSPVLDLAPDGSRFVYLGFDSDGSQSVNLYDFASGETTNLLRRPLAEGVASFPRFSPDGSQLAYLLQQGDPQAGLSYAIHLLSLADGAERELVAGNVGLSVPTWAPDGAHLAFVRPASGEPVHVLEGQTPPPESVNVWVVRLADGALQQITTLAGQARSPQWSTDSRTLAFLSEDGQVGMVSLDAPGQMWAAAGPAEFPLLSSMFFVP